MKDIQPFNENPECPKCRTMSPVLEFCWLTDGREYLKVTCGECGYHWNMETADAKEKQVILENLVTPNPEAEKAMEEKGIKVEGFVRERQPFGTEEHLNSEPTEEEAKKDEGTELAPAAKDEELAVEDK